MDEELARPRSEEKNLRQDHNSPGGSKELLDDAVISQSAEEPGAFRTLTKRLLTWGVETHGCVHQLNAFSLSAELSNASRMLI